jgi:acyl-CoA-binding protein
MDLMEELEQAAERAKQLPTKPDNDVLLKLYGLYKQATEGDVSGDKPGMFDFVAKAKYEAWEARQGMSTEEAVRAYVDLVERLEDEL